MMASQKKPRDLDYNFGICERSYVVPHKWKVLTGSVEKRRGVSFCQPPGYLLSKKVQAG